MIKITRLPLFFLLISLLGSFLPAQAQPLHKLTRGEKQLKKVVNRPCRYVVKKPGHAHNVSKFFCGGWRGADAEINVLVRGWEVQPAYPIVGLPFSVGIGIDPRSASRHTTLSTVKKATWKETLRIHNLKTELRLVPVQVTGSFNGDIGSDASVRYRGFSAEDDPKPAGPFPAPETYTISDLYNPHYSSTGDGSYPPGKDTATLYLTALTSSYHAADPSTYQGEPAYRLHVTSHYMAEARVSWSAYQEWVRVQVGTYRVCSPGPTNTGTFECFVNPGDPVRNGHYVEYPLYDWRWGSKQDGGTGDWVPIAVVTTDKVGWPDGSIHDHIPVLVYQSQPLLQKP